MIVLSLACLIISVSLWIFHGSVRYPALPTTGGNWSISPAAITGIPILSITARISIGTIPASSIIIRSNPYKHSLGMNTILYFGLLNTGSNIGLPLSSIIGTSLKSYNQEKMVPALCIPFVRMLIAADPV